MLELVDDDQMAADGPVGIAVVRRLEGAMLALTAIDTTTTPLVQTERNVRSRAPDTS